MHNTVRCCCCCRTSNFELRAVGWTTFVWNKTGRFERICEAVRPTDRIYGLKNTNWAENGGFFYGKTFDTGIRGGRRPSNCRREIHEFCKNASRKSSFSTKDVFPPYRVVDWTDVSSPLEFRFVLGELSDTHCRFLDPPQCTARVRFIRVADGAGGGDGDALILAYRVRETCLNRKMILMRIKYHIFTSGSNKNGKKQEAFDFEKKKRTKRDEKKRIKMLF